MKILLDTNIYIWWINNSPQLSENSKIKIRNSKEVFISVATILEISQLISEGKVDVDFELIVKAIKQNGFKELSITAEHAAIEFYLPQLHNDHFDRILISQAVCDQLYLFTADNVLADYSELVVLL